MRILPFCFTNFYENIFKKVLPTCTQLVGARSRACLECWERIKSLKMKKNHLILSLRKNALNVSNSLLKSRNLILSKTFMLKIRWSASVVASDFGPTTSFLYYKHIMIINDDSSIVSKWQVSLIDDAELPFTIVTCL